MIPELEKALAAQTELETVLKHILGPVSLYRRLYQVFRVDWTARKYTQDIPEHGWWDYEHNDWCALYPGIHAYGFVCDGPMLRFAALHLGDADSMREVHYSVPLDLLNHPAEYLSATRDTFVAQLQPAIAQLQADLLKHKAAYIELSDSAAASGPAAAIALKGMAAVEAGCVCTCEDTLRDLSEIISSHSKPPGGSDVAT